MKSVDGRWLELISELVDETAGDKPVDFEGYDYENIKKLSILGAVQSYTDIHDLDIDENSKQISLLSILSYLIMENTVLWMDNKKMADSILKAQSKLH